MVKMLGSKVLKKCSFERAHDIKAYRSIIELHVDASRHRVALIWMCEASYSTFISLALE